MMLITMLNLAQYRSREIGRAWQQIISRRAGQGRHHGRVPAGYRRGDDGRLEPAGLAAAAVVDAFRAYAGGQPVRQVRRRLCEQLGTHITESGFKRLLGNPVYRGTVRVQSAAGPVHVDDAHPPLVDEDLWEQVQRRIRRDRRTPSRTLEVRYSITGIAYCGRCGGPAGCTPQRKPNGQDRGHGVFCRDHRQGRGRCRGCGMLTLEYVEDEILRQVAAYVAELRGDVATQAARAARAARAGVDVAALERELADTRRAMARLTERWAREQTDDAAYDEAMAQLRAAAAQLAEQVDAAREQQTAPPAAEVVNLAERLIDMWPEMEPHERNRVLRQLGARITIAPAAYHAQPARERVTVELP